MLTPEQAKQIILENLQQPKPIYIDILSSLGCVLAEDVKAPLDMPLFDNSAMDGYAVVCDCDGDRFKIVGESYAGNPFLGSVREGEAVYVGTGGRIPNGANAVVKVEDADVHPNGFITVKKKIKVGENIRKRGEEVKAGEIIIKKGSYITPIVVSYLAQFGIEEVKVYKKPSVSVITTGDEIVEPGSKLEEGKIFDSNSFFLRTILQKLGFPFQFLGTVKDVEKELVSKIEQSFISESDFILITGGVSVGERDIVKDVVEQRAERIFWKVSQKPGKPLYFARSQDKLIFGLPGNPVSCVICFFIYVLPALFKFCGIDHSFPKKSANFIGDFSSHDGRLTWLRVGLTEKDGKLFAQPLKKQGSHMLSSLILSDGVVGAYKIKDGEQVEVIQFSDIVKL